MTNRLPFAEMVGGEVVNYISLGRQLIDVELLAKELDQKTLDLRVSEGFVVVHHIITESGVVMQIRVVDRLLKLAGDSSAKFLLYSDQVNVVVVFFVTLGLFFRII